MLVAILWILGLLYILICVVLILFVLIQEGKSGGLAGSETPGAAPSQLIDTFGAGKTQQGLFRATLAAATIFFVIAASLTLIGRHRDKVGGNIELPSAAPAAQTTPLATSTDAIKGEAVAPAAPAPVDASKVPPAPAEEVPVTK